MNGLVAIVPARGGSKRVVNKNMRQLGGKPMIQWTLEAAKSASCVSAVYVTTEDPEIATFCDDFGVGVIERPPHLAGDHVHATKPVVSALRQLQEYPFVAMLLPTSPFRTSGDIDEAFKQFESPSVTSVVGVIKTGFGRENIVTIKKIPPYYTDDITYVLGKKDLKQRAELEDIYAVNGAIFMAETRFFLREENFHAGQPVAYVMPRKNSLEVDTEEDFAAAEEIV